MAAFDLEEQEKLDELKAWWKRWGNAVTIGVAAILFAAAGYEYWKNHAARQNDEAAAYFNRMRQALQAGDKKLAKDTGAVLIDKFSGTAYATRAAMTLATLNARDKDVKSAKAQLEWTIEHTKEAALRDVSRLRLAGLLLDERKYDEALAQLNAAHSDAYAPRFDDMKGDVYLAQGKHEEARAAYSAAFAKLKETSPLRGLVEMKLDSLGGPKS
ncbi:MAG: tetratricopeptide repeat protein [Hydrogenophilaceae bacterium]|nr:tetratricopeptide repeat protein [Hydrogenophilaceae bacterium]